MANSKETAAQQAAFYIPATNLPARPHRTLKHNDTFAIFDSHGDIGAASGSSDGLFHCDTRYLSQLELLIDALQPLLLGSEVRDDNLHYYVDLTNPDIFVDGSIVLLRDTIHIGRTIYLYEGSLRERIVLTNHGATPAKFRISMTFASDFADIFELRGVARSRRGVTWAGTVDAGTCTLNYRGLDDVERHTFLNFEPIPTALFDSVAQYDVALAPGGSCKIFATASSRDAMPASTREFFRGLAGLHRERNELMRNTATVETSNAVVNEILSRSLADLYMLTTVTPDGRYPYAGIPWYSTTFGRDGLITALETLWLDPSMAAGVLRRLARLQADTSLALADANPGKILHEMRAGEMAELGEVPFSRYYGSIDATPLFVVLAGFYARRTGDYGLIRELWPAIELALVWIDNFGDLDGDGFVEYQRAAVTGLANQGWKDSHDSVFHADGRLAEGPIALVEVQGYVYAAKKWAGYCARGLGLSDTAATLENQAEVLRASFENAYWCEELGTYALALDGSKLPCRVRTSNPGQLLFTGICAADRARRVVANLFDHAFFSGWGIRTVAEGEARFNPMSYHNGSIWPHDNALIAFGMAFPEARHAVGTLFESLMLAASYMDGHRLPELFCGFRRRKGRGPIPYPTACSPQAWASGAPFLLIQSMLGMHLDHAEKRIELVNPILPASLQEITIRNLRIGEASGDFTVRRSGKSLSLERASRGLRVSLIRTRASHGARQ